MVVKDNMFGRLVLQRVCLILCEMQQKYSCWDTRSRLLPCLHLECQLLLVAAGDQTKFGLPPCGENLQPAVAAGDALPLMCAY